jgi:hypothetical protein
MPKAEFVFKKYSNSFSVDIKNLTQLSVHEIQQIEDFVSARKGVFNFETHSFTLQKRLDFQEFITLLKYSDIDASCEEEIRQRDIKAKVGFGKYKGMFYSELPDNYLLWLKGNYRGKDRDEIISELNTRALF